MSTSTLPAKSLLEAGMIRSRAPSSSICLVPALAKISAGAPDSICFCNTPDAPKLNLIFVPVRCSSILAISLKASLRLTAAEITNSFDEAGELDRQPDRNRETNSRRYADIGTAAVRHEGPLLGVIQVDQKFNLAP